MLFVQKDFNFSCGVLVNVSNETRDLLLFSSLRLHRQLSCLFPIRQKEKKEVSMVIVLLVIIFILPSFLANALYTSNYS